MNKVTEEKMGKKIKKLAPTRFKALEIIYQDNMVLPTKKGHI